MYPNCLITAIFGSGPLIHGRPKYFGSKRVGRWNSNTLRELTGEMPSPPAETLLATTHSVQILFFFSREVFAHVHMSIYAGCLICPPAQMSSLPKKRISPDTPSNNAPGFVNLVAVNGTNRSTRDAGLPSPIGIKMQATNWAIFVWKRCTDIKPSGSHIYHCVVSVWVKFCAAQHVVKRADYSTNERAGGSIAQAPVISQ